MTKNHLLVILTMLFCFCLPVAVYAEETATEYLMFDNNQYVSPEEVEQLGDELALTKEQMEMIEKLMFVLHTKVSVSVSPDIADEDKAYRFVQVHIINERRKDDLLPQNATIWDAIEYYIDKLPVFAIHNNKYTCADITEQHTLQYIDFVEDGVYKTRGINSTGHIFVVTNSKNFVFTERGIFENVPIIETVLDEDFGTLESAESMAGKCEKYRDSFFGFRKYENYIKEFSWTDYQSIEAIIERK